MAIAVEDETIDAVFVSPMQRAISTAEPLALPRSLQLQVLPGLIEIDFGNLQGQAKGENPFNLRRDFAETPMPGGESLKDVWQRLDEPCSRLREVASAGLSAAVVCHYWSGRMLFGMLQGQSFSTSIGKSKYKPSNASAFALKWSERHFIADRWLMQTWPRS